MLLQRIAISAVLVAGLAALPVSDARAQYYGPPCTPFPLTWPFCVVGAAVGTAVAIVTVPFRVVAPPPYYYPPPPAYPPPAYSTAPPPR